MVEDIWLINAFDNNNDDDDDDNDDDHNNNNNKNNNNNGPRVRNSTHNRTSATNSLKLEW